MYFDRRDIMANTQKWWKSFNEKTMTVKVEIACEMDEDEIEEQFSENAARMIDEEGCVDLPMKFVVCPTCRGKGSHVNPSIDAHGISAEEWDRDWGEEEREMYLSGGYDVPCYECDGRRVVPEINTDPCYFTPEVKEFKEYVEDSIADEASYVRTCMMERAMGA